jgi:hypothetical protein
MIKAETFRLDLRGKDFEFIFKLCEEAVGNCIAATSLLLGYAARKYSV